MAMFGRTFAAAAAGVLHRRRTPAPRPAVAGSGGCSPARGRPRGRRGGRGGGRRGHVPAPRLRWADDRTCSAWAGRRRQGDTVARAVLRRIQAPAPRPAGPGVRRTGRPPTRSPPRRVRDGRAQRGGQVVGAGRVRGAREPLGQRELQHRAARGVVDRTAGTGERPLRRDERARPPLGRRSGLRRVRRIETAWPASSATHDWRRRWARPAGPTWRSASPGRS